MIEQNKTKTQKTIKSHIIAIGGGKGGTGKSLITSSLGICLSNRGNNVLLIDADLGTANLHTFLGLEPPEVGLSEFLSNKKLNLSGIINRTEINNLNLISGAKDMIGIANLSYKQKEKLLTNIKKLNYNYILLDLGPGTYFNILDFFLISNCGILITSPEPTSIENTYRFTKSILFRYLRTAIREKEVKHLIENGVSQRKGKKFESVFDLVDAIEKIEPRLGGIIEKYLSSLDIKLIVNQVHTNKDRDIGKKMALAARKSFGISIDFLGNVSHDSKVRKGIRQKKPLLTYLSHSKAFKELNEITRKISPCYQLKFDFSIDQHF